MSDIKTIAMTRPEPAHPGGPTVADVHPDEVANFQAGGWAVCPAKPAKAEKPEKPEAPAK